MVYIFIFRYTQNALETMHSLPQLELWNVHLSGGFYSDTLGYVADGCKKCPNGSYVAYDKKPGKSVLDCKTCPDGSNQTCAFWRHQRVLSYKCVYTLSNAVFKLGKNEEKWFELKQPYLSLETNLALRQESNVAIPFPVLASLCMVGFMIFFFFNLRVLFDALRFIGEPISWSSPQSIFARTSGVKVWERILSTQRW